MKINPFNELFDQQTHREIRKSAIRYPAGMVALNHLPDLRDLAGNVSEGHARAHLRDLGWEVTKRGWPDFFGFDPDGKVIAVEVKPVGDKITLPQQRCLAALQELGARCFVAFVSEDGAVDLQPFNEERHRSKHDRRARKSGRYRPHPPKP